jgi:hypothetical protein
MASDVFVISSACDSSALTTIRHAVELAGVNPARVRDAVFGFDGFLSLPDLDSITRDAGLACPSVAVSSSLRALFFSAASILSDDVDLAVAIGLYPEACAALVLASPESVGLLNLLPRARLAARSLTGAEPAHLLTGLTSDDVQIRKDGERGALLVSELLEELESQSARWGTVTVAALTLLVERI